MIWALDGQVAGRAVAVARPASPAQVADVLRVCNDARMPVTAAAGRSGVCGASVPLHGGVVLDVCGLHGIVDFDARSRVVDVRAGTFGTPLEDTLRRDHAVTLGHWPQSIDLSTVGGWLACRSAGQLSTRYGKIEDIVEGLDVVLADGTAISTGGAPRAAVGPDLTQLFVGSEGTLGIITGARLRVHPAPPAHARAAFGFTSFVEGLDACRRILQRGATPAVLRLYDTVEAERNFGTGTHHLLLTLDEGDAHVVDATMRIVARGVRRRHRARRGTRRPVARAPQRRFRARVVDRERLRRRHDGDRWSVARPPGDLLGRDRGAARGRRDGRGVGTPVARLHRRRVPLLHLRRRARCRTPGPTTTGPRGTPARRAVLGAGGALSHHHGVGMNRARFARDRARPRLRGARRRQGGLDPQGILNPGKLGLDSPFGPGPAWP